MAMQNDHLFLNPEESQYQNYNTKHSLNRKVRFSNSNNSIQQRKLNQHLNHRESNQHTFYR